MSNAPLIQLYPDELIIDNFAGGGGASLGIELALGRSPDIAINHDPEAISMHRANHPNTRHYCESVWNVSPKKACAGRPVGLAWFSPDCKHFSKAKGGKPVDKAIRGLAWVVVRWARDVRPRLIFVENVEEFQHWTKVLPDGRPCPATKGETFRRWVNELRGLGYQVEWRELRACDYGAPTSRKRLFLIARCDGLPIVWPEPTHGPGLPDNHRAAAECIDWSLPCPSIFERARPLAENTLRRIARGIKRYVLEANEPFIVGVGGRMGQSPERPVSRPMQTITAKADSALLMPTIVRIGHTGHGDGGKTKGIDEPLSTITSKAEHCLVAPTLVQTGYGERPGQTPRSLDLQQPLGTVVGCGVKHALVSAFLAKHYEGAVGQRLEQPLGTVTAIDHHSLVTAHIQRDFGKSIGSAAAEPLPTITGGGGGKSAVVATHLMKLRGGFSDHHTTAQDMREPAPTITASGTHLAEVRAFLIKYYGTDGDPLLGEPLHTVTTRDRFGLVTVAGEQYEIADIGLRMLAPRELFRAQGFPDTYEIEIQHEYPRTNKQKRLGLSGLRTLSKTAQVRMCGNSVSPPMGAALVLANVGATAAMGPAAEAWTPGCVKSGEQLPLFDLAAIA